MSNNNNIWSILQKRWSNMMCHLWNIVLFFLYCTFLVLFRSPQHKIRYIIVIKHISVSVYCTVGQMIVRLLYKMQIKCLKMSDIVKKLWIYYEYLFCAFTVTVTLLQTCQKSYWVGDFYIYNYIFQNKSPEQH